MLKKLTESTWSGCLRLFCRLIKLRCVNCGAIIGQDKGPPTGWRLEDGRRVCHACCIQNFKYFVRKMINPGDKADGTSERTPAES